MHNNKKVEIIGVRFREMGKIYYYSATGYNISLGAGIIAETAKGIEYGLCEMPNKFVEKTSEIQNLKPIIRLASHYDREKLKTIKIKEENAKEIFKEKILDYKFDMKLVEVSITFDQSKIIFYFTSQNRIDFRELVKELASIFRMRIELRQIGVRDEAKILNGAGICGRKLCCALFLDDFRAVSIKMAKDQGLSANPSKLSGACGRLRCCLKYEQDTYEELGEKMPGVGDSIKLEDGRYGEVLSISTLKQEIRAIVRKNAHDTPMIDVFCVEDFKITKKAPVEARE